MPSVILSAENSTVFNPLGLKRGASTQQALTVVRRPGPAHVYTTEQHTAAMIGVQAAAMSDPTDRCPIKDGGLGEDYEPEDFDEGQIVEFRQSFDL